MVLVLNSVDYKNARAPRLLFFLLLQILYTL